MSCITIFYLIELLIHFRLYSKSKSIPKLMVVWRLWSSRDDILLQLLDLLPKRWEHNHIDWNYHLSKKIHEKSLNEYPLRMINSLSFQLTAAASSTALTATLLSPASLLSSSSSSTSRVSSVVYTSCNFLRMYFALVAW